MKVKEIGKVIRNPETEEFEHTVEKAGSFAYRKTKFDKFGWANANHHKPIPFDLVTVLTGENKEKGAWWAKTHWDGLRLKQDDSVVKWKRRKYEWIQTY